MTLDNTCELCFSDSEIRKFIRRKATIGNCDFCKATKTHIAPVDAVCELIRASIGEEYDDPNNCLPWDSREGGWQAGKVYSSEELLFEIDLELPNDNSGALHERILGYLGDQEWCDKEPFHLSKSERLAFNWEEFCNEIKFRTRYFFMKQPPPPIYLDNGESRSIPEFLRVLAKICIELKIPRTVKKDMKLFRARFQEKGKNLCDTVDLGPPSEGGTLKPNRMSPAGIVHFYASSTARTAFAEIKNKPGIYKVGEFAIKNHPTLLDFTKPLQIPSFFDPSKTKERHRVIFIRKFIAELSRPVNSTRINIDYTPTQVICEYFRTQVKIGNNSIDGLCYPSSKRKAGKSYVLFANQYDLDLSEREFQKLKKLNRLSEHYQRKTGWIRLDRVTSITNT